MYAVYFAHPTTGAWHQYAAGLGLWEARQVASDLHFEHGHRRIELVSMVDGMILPEWRLDGCGPSSVRMAGVTL